ncbi:hypothetical protein [Streptomyces sp. 7-21]|jgi:ATP synthase protein I|uniref:hypothetical protein n=1 Tax=Streptomyces sp. 7-21 TaxID=2802283 RepID=UPI00191D7E44|nr:hypothetical protein [Streptomyces sp. 7-21]MBL1065333.1 hypothetical protein [Streptomyces sp. 7-21]
MQSNDARIIRGAAIPTAVAGALAVVAGAVTAGADGAVGAGLGVLVAAAFFGFGLLTLSYVGKRWPDLFFGAAFVIYTTQMGLLLLLLLMLRDASFLHGRAFAVGVVVGTAAWLGGQARMHMTLKTPYVEPRSSAAARGGSS